MDTVKERRLREIEQASLREAAHLAGEFARAASAEREAILAQLEHDHWVAQGCRESRDWRR